MLRRQGDLISGSPVKVRIARHLLRIVLAPVDETRPGGFPRHESRVITEKVKRCCRVPHLNLERSRVRASHPAHAGCCDDSPLLPVGCS